jgi:hypothetical protein
MEYDGQVVRWTTSEGRRPCGELALRSYRKSFKLEVAGSLSAYGGRRHSDLNDSGFSDVVCARVRRLARLGRRMS